MGSHPAFMNEIYLCDGCLHSNSMNAIVIISEPLDEDYINRAFSMLNKGRDTVFVFYIHGEGNLFEAQKALNTNIRALRKNGWKVVSYINRKDPVESIERLTKSVEDTVIVVPKGDVKAGAFVTIALEESLKKRVKATVISLSRNV